jgi:hypothetical protein
MAAGFIIVFPAAGLRIRRQESIRQSRPRSAGIWVDAFARHAAQTGTSVSRGYIAARCQISFNDNSAMIYLYRSIHLEYPSRYKN